MQEEEDVEQEQTQEGGTKAQHLQRSSKEDEPGGAGWLWPGLRVVLRHVENYGRSETAVSPASRRLAVRDGGEELGRSGRGWGCDDHLQHLLHTHR